MNTMSNSRSRWAATPLVAMLLTAVAAGAESPVPLQPATEIKIPAAPGKFDFLAVDSVRHRLLAAHEKDGTADFIDLQGGTVLARVKVGTAVGIIPDANASRYYVSVQEGKRVAIVDGETLREIGSVPLAGETDAILFDAKDDSVYVTHDNAEAVYVIDAPTAKLKATIAVPAGPECMAHDAASDRLFLNSKETNQVVVIDTRSNQVSGRWPTAPVTGPHGLVFDAALQRIYVSGDNGLLVAIDTNSGAVVSSASITPHVDQIAFDPGTHRVFCAGPDHLSVVAATLEGVRLLGQVDSAATAKNVAVDPATHWVWTTYTDGKDSYARSWKQL